MRKHLSLEKTLNASLWRRKGVFFTFLLQVLIGLYKKKQSHSVIKPQPDGHTLHARGP